MRSPTHAITWTFWRLGLFGLVSVIAMMILIASLVYGGLSIDEGVTLETVAPEPLLHVYMFVFCAGGLCAAVCEAHGTASRLFTLPVSVRKLVIVNAVNGVVAAAGGYLLMAFILNGFFDAQWPVVKPAIGIACIFMISQTSAWIFGASDYPKSGGIASVLTMIVTLAAYTFIQGSFGDVSSMWHGMTVFDWCLAVFIPPACYIATVTGLTCARRGQGISFASIYRVLLERFDLRLKDPTHLKSANAAELWSEWWTRGIVMPSSVAGVCLVGCVAFLCARVEWVQAVEVTAAVTTLMVNCGVVLGLYIGHAGERFDVNEFTAARPLSDKQLADVKLFNTFKSVAWSWVVWVVGVSLIAVCLLIAGQGPASFDAAFPSSSAEQPVVFALVCLAVAIITSWTSTSLGVSVVLLRGAVMLPLVCMAGVGPLVCFVLIRIDPALGPVLQVAAFWSLIGLTTLGTLAAYVVALRLKLVSFLRAAVAAISYLLLCSAMASGIAQMRPDTDLVSRIAIACSTSVLPFVSFAAVPLAISWNRHR